MCRLGPRILATQILSTEKSFSFWWRLPESQNSPPLLSLGFGRCACLTTGKAHSVPTAFLFLQRPSAPPDTGPANSTVNGGTGEPWVLEALTLIDLAPEF